MRIICQQGLIFSFLLILLMLSLLPCWSYLGIIPNFVSVILYLWTIYRPDLNSRRLYIVLGIVRDGLFGYPLGLSIIEILLLVSTTNLLRRYILNKSYWIVYAGYGIFISLSHLFIWATLSCLKGVMLPFDVVINSSIFNILSYPLFCHLSVPLQNRIDSLGKRAFE